jgi:hypothetical protein
LNVSPFRLLTTPWIFCFVPSGTWTGVELVALWADNRTADSIKNTMAIDTSPADLFFVMSVLLLKLLTAADSGWLFAAI